MYPLTNITKVSPTEYRARSESRPEHSYTIIVVQQGYRCTCPAGEHGRPCKHSRTLDKAFRVCRALQRSKPAFGEVCPGQRVHCGFLRIALWRAVRHLAWLTRMEKEQPITDPVVALARQQSYRCKDCKSYMANLLLEIYEAAGLARKKAARANQRDCA